MVISRTAANWKVNKISQKMFQQKNMNKKIEAKKTEWFFVLSDKMKDGGLELRCYSTISSKKTPDLKLIDKSEEITID